MIFRSFSGNETSNWGTGWPSGNILDLGYQCMWCSPKHLTKYWKNWSEWITTWSPIILLWEHLLPLLPLFPRLWQRSWTHATHATKGACGPPVACDACVAWYVRRAVIFCYSGCCRPAVYAWLRVGECRKSIISGRWCMMSVFAAWWIIACLHCWIGSVKRIRAHAIAVYTASAAVGITAVLPQNGTMAQPDGVLGGWDVRFRCGISVTITWGFGWFRS